jgi:hypothetical protein
MPLFDLMGLYIFNTSINDWKEGRYVLVEISGLNFKCSFPICKKLSSKLIFVMYIASYNVNAPPIPVHFTLNQDFNTSLPSDMCLLAEVYFYHVYLSPWNLLSDMKNWSTYIYWRSTKTNLQKCMQQLKTSQTKVVYSANPLQYKMR